MVTQMNDRDCQTLEQIRCFLQGTESIEFRVQGKDEDQAPVSRRRCQVLQCSIACFSLFPQRPSIAGVVCLAHDLANGRS